MLQIKYGWVVYSHLPTNKEIIMNKPITMMELEEFMSHKKEYLMLTVKI